VSLKRVLNVPRRGVGATSLARLDAFAAESSMTFGDALRHAQDAGVTGRALGGINAFLELMDDLRAMLAAEAGAAPAELVLAVLERTGYLDELRAEGGSRAEVEGRVDNVEELVGAARKAATLEDFLTEVSLVAGADEVGPGEVGIDASCVTLMTLHTAKGLEYPVVFIVGMEEGVFPHLRSLGEPHELEEERRLCYVGVTRARERLYLSNARCRSLWGDEQYNLPSRFLGEIPDHLVVSSGPRQRERRSQGRGELRDQLVETALHRGRSGTQPQGTGAEALRLRPGETIVHARYGEGVVLEVYGEGMDAEAMIRFPQGGEKRFSLHMAPIKRA